MNWLRRLFCRHESIEVRTFIENDGAPCVRRTTKCTRCGHYQGLIPDQMPHDAMLKLLERANELPIGSSVEI